MPTEETLSVRFIGDERSLEKSSNNAAKTLDKVNIAAETTTKGLGKVSLVSDNVAKSAQQLAKSSSVAGGSLDKTSRSSNAASQSLINLSRIAQDAPYGFLGIANNINPMLESFQRVQQEAGSTGGALKSIAAGLAGPAGLGLAVGVVSSLLVTFGDKLFDSKEKTESQEDALKNLNATLAESKNKFDDVIESIGQLDKLGSINIKIAGLSPILDLQGAKVSKDFAVAAAEDREQELLKIYSSTLNQSQEIQDAAFKSLRDHQAELSKLRFERTVAERQIALQRKEDSDDALQKTKEAQEKEAKLLQEHNERVKKIVEARRLEIKQYLNSSLQTNDFKPEISDRIRRDLINIQPSDQLTTLRPRFEILPQVSFNSKGFKELMNTEFVDKVNGIMEIAAANIQVETVTGVAKALGEGIVKGLDFGDQLKLVGERIGEFLVTLGEQLLQAAIQATIAKKAFKKLLANPGLAAAVGIGLIVVGKAIQAKLSQQPREFAAGGIVTGPTLGLIGEGRGTTRSNPEIVAPLNKLHQFLAPAISGGGEGTLRLRGNDLIYAIARNDRRQRRVR